MPVHAALAAASFLCGLAVGLAVNLLVKERVREGASADVLDPAPVWQPSRPLLLLTPLLLGAASR